MSVRLPRAVLDAIRAAGEASFPEECCGFLVGKTPDDFADPGRTVTVEEARPLPNGWESTARTHRYQIDPKVFARTEAELSGSGRAIVGLYHSHPSVPAWPSPFDLDRAWPCYSYLIVCVRDKKAQESRSWVRTEDGRSFLEEDIMVLEGT